MKLINDNNKPLPTKIITKMASILVTGGSGFVGQHLIKRLSLDKHKITSPDRSEVDLANYDPKEKSLTKNHDILIHLASYVNINDLLQNPQETIANNINSTLNLLEDIRLNNPSCFFIFLSSEKVYGNAAGNLNSNIFNINTINLDEESSTLPVDPYGSSKLISENLIKTYHLNYNLNYLILRPANIFGPGQRPGLFIPSIITKIIKHPEKVTLGNLEAYRNFIYIEDLINAIINCLKIIEKNPTEKSDVHNQTFNLSVYNLKIAEVLKELIAQANIAKINPNIVQDKNLFRASETQAKRIFLDCKKANKLLNWQPQHQFSEAIKTTFNNYLNNYKNNQNK